MAGRGLAPAILMFTLFSRQSTEQRLARLQKQPDGLERKVGEFSGKLDAVSANAPVGPVLISQLTRKTFEQVRFGYPHEDQHKELIWKLRNYTMVTGGGLLSAMDQICHLDRANIEGDVLELGCFHGGLLALMALAHMRNSAAPVRTFYGFDSFCGLPQPDRRHDTDTAAIQRDWNIPEYAHNGLLLPTGMMVADLALCEQCIYDVAQCPRDRVKLCKGWFQDTVPAMASSIKQIALLRLDGDLYASYKFGLEALYAKVVPGGFIVYDDLAYAGPRKAVEEFFAALPPGQRPYLHMVDFTVGFMIKHNPPSPLP